MTIKRKTMSSRANMVNPSNSPNTKAGSNLHSLKNGRHLRLKYSKALKHNTSAPVSIPFAKKMPKR
jgi:hypothetical protein